MELEVRVRKTRAIGNLTFVSTESSMVFLLLAHLPGFNKADIEVQINETRREIIVSGGGRIESMEFVSVFRIANIAQEVNAERFCQRFMAPENADFVRVNVVFDEEEEMLMVLIPKLVREHIEDEEVSCGGGNDRFSEEVESITDSNEPALDHIETYDTSNQPESPQELEVGDENRTEGESMEAEGPDNAMADLQQQESVGDISPREVELIEIEEQKEAPVMPSNDLDFTESLGPEAPYEAPKNRPCEQESNLFELSTESFEPEVPYETPEDKPGEEESNLLELNTESLEPEVPNGASENKPWEGEPNLSEPKQRSSEVDEESENEEGSQMEEEAQMLRRKRKRRRKRSSPFPLKPTTLFAGSAFIFAVAVLVIHFLKHRNPKLKH